MQILKQETFEHEGRKFLLRVFKSNDGYAAAGYYDKEQRVTANYDYPMVRIFTESFRENQDEKLRTLNHEIQNIRITFEYRVTAICN